MSVPLIDAWLDEDGSHVWTEHPCVDGKMVKAMLPHPQWSADEAGRGAAAESGRVNPSVHCLACGAHQFVNVTHGRWWLEGASDET